MRAYDCRDVSIVSLCTWWFCLTIKMTIAIFNFVFIEKFTCVAVFIISNDDLYSEAVLEECVVEKLTLIPDHTKLVFSHCGWKNIDKVPETLQVSYPSSFVFPFFTQMIEIFNKRWQTLDLISMMQELKRTYVQGYRITYGSSIFIENSLSSLPIFQKKEEEHSSIVTCTVCLSA